MVRLQQRVVRELGTLAATVLWRVRVQEIEGLSLAGAEGSAPSRIGLGRDDPSKICQRLLDALGPAAVGLGLVLLVLKLSRVVF